MNNTEKELGRYVISLLAVLCLLYEDGGLMWCEVWTLKVSLAKMYICILIILGLLILGKLCFIYCDFRIFVFLLNLLVSLSVNLQAVCYFTYLSSAEFNP